MRELPADVWRVMNDFDHAMMRGNKELTLNTNDFMKVVDHIRSLEQETDHLYRDLELMTDKYQDLGDENDRVYEDLHKIEKVC
jgi:hypothetical protein